MHRILVFSNDDIFTHRLESAAKQRDDLEVAVVRTVDDAREVLSTEPIDAILVGDSAAELDGDERAQLLSADGRITAVFSAGEAVFEELHDDAHLGEGADVDKILARLREFLSRTHSRANGPESGAYFVSDTQGRSLIESSGGLDRHTSHAEVDHDWTPRLLYVGGNGEFRRDLEEQARAAGVDLVLFDEPREVSLPAGAPPLDLVLISVEYALSTTRHLIRYLRRRQPEAPFEVLLLANSDTRLRKGLGKSLGADEALEHPVDFAGLFRRARQRGYTDRADLLVLTSDPSRINLIRSALAREPVSAVFASDVDEVEDTFGSWPVDLVLVDDTPAEFDAAATVRRLRKSRPFASTCYLGLIEQDSAPSAAFDDSLRGPILPSDIRRFIRLHLTQINWGRAELERDQLTNVSSTLALGDDLQARLDRSFTTGDLVVLIAVDVDNLGQVNRRYGRAVGDSVLRSLADALHLAAGDRRMIYRTDADEFFVLQHTDLAGWPALRDRFDRALHVFRQQTFRAVDGRGTYATASAGAVVVPAVGVSAEYCMQKSWVVLDRASSTRQERLLVAQLDPSAVPDTESSRDRSNEHT